MNSGVTPRAFTSYSTGGLLRALVNECRISESYLPTASSGPPPTNNPYQALWDTGATGSVITQRVIDELGLVATGKTLVHGVSGQTTRDTFLVNIILPNHVVIPGVRVTHGDLSNSIDLLIGMDVISLGDFAVSNFNGRSRFTFRIPSLTDIDFVEELNPGLKGSKRRPKRSKLSSQISKAIKK